MKKLLFSLALLLTGTFLFAQEPKTDKSLKNPVKTHKAQGASHGNMKPKADLYPEATRVGNKITVTVRCEGEEGAEAMPTLTYVKCSGIPEKRFETPKMMHGGEQSHTFELPANVQSQSIDVEVIADYKKDAKTLKHDKKGKIKEENEENNVWKGTLSSDDATEAIPKKRDGGDK